MNLINKSDPRYFEVTSDKPYDRHKYKINFPDGHSMVVDAYDQMRGMWFQHLHNWKGVTIEVIDRKKESKGFK